MKLSARDLIISPSDFFTGIVKLFSGSAVSGFDFSSPTGIAGDAGDAGAEGIAAAAESGTT